MDLASPPPSPSVHSRHPFKIILGSLSSSFWLIFGRDGVPVHYNDCCFQLPQEHQSLRFWEFGFGFLTGNLQNHLLFSLLSLPGYIH